MKIREEYMYMYNELTLTTKIIECNLVETLAYRAKAKS